MKDEDFKLKVIEELGSLKTDMRVVKNRLGKMNGSIAEHAKKLAKHDVVIGKAGVIFATIIFIVTTAVNFVVAFIKDKITK